MSMEKRLKEAEEAADRAHAAHYKSDGTPGEPAPASQADGGSGKNPDPEQKYKVLKGKYDNEVPLLHKQVQELNQRNQELEAKINSRSTLEDGGAVGLDLDLSDDKLPENLKDFKGEYPDVFNGVSAMMKAAKLGTPKKVEAPPPAAAAPVKTAPAQANAPWTPAMYQQLADKCPNWKQINTHPEFLGWLADNDRYTRKTRRALLGEAFAAHDIDTVANIMQDWEKFFLVKQDHEPDDVAPPAGGGGLGSGGDGGGGGNQPVRITQAEINKFYTDVALNKYKGRDEERKAMEAKIDAAVAGRNIG